MPQVFRTGPNEKRLRFRNWKLAFVGEFYAFGFLGKLRTAAAMTQSLFAIGHSLMQMIIGVPIGRIEVLPIPAGAAELVTTVGVEAVRLRLPVMLRDILHSFCTHVDKSPFK